MADSIPLSRVPPGPIKLDGREVHVWRGSLEQPPSLIESFLRTLAPDERSRAERFHFDKHRNHFIAARGILRDLLGRYLDIEPARVRFRYTEYGKPLLIEQHFDLRFNVSHSHELALFAVARGRELGVDLEWIRSGLADEQIAERFFSAQEVRALRSLPKQEQDLAFLNCWTRKEAYIKAKGEGLSMPLDQFDVTLAPGEEAALLCTRSDPQEAPRWRLRELFPGPDYVGAIAVEGKDWELKWLEWPG